jgi:hypothetical protein
MDTTPNFGWPYPECDPPLVEDAALIGQLGELAWAIDADVQVIADRAQVQLIAPQHARVSQSADVPSTDTLVVPDFNSVQFDPNSLVNVGGDIVVDESAWWLVGGYANVSSGVALNAKLRFTVGGLPVTSWTDQAANYTTGQHPYGMAMLQIPDGEQVSMEITYTGAPAGTLWNHRGFLWVLKVLAA